MQISAQAPLVPQSQAGLTEKTGGEQAFTTKGAEKTGYTDGSVNFGENSPKKLGMTTEEKPVAMQQQSGNNLIQGLQQMMLQMMQLMQQLMAKGSSEGSDCGKTDKPQQTNQANQADSTNPLKQFLEMLMQRLGLSQNEDKSSKDAGGQSEGKPSGGGSNNMMQQMMGMMQGMMALMQNLIGAIAGGGSNEGSKTEGKTQA